MRIAICLPTKGRASQMKERVNHLLLQPLPAGIDLIVSLAILRDDTETLRAVNGVIDMWYDSDVTVLLTYRPLNSTAVDGWNRAYSAVADIADWFVLGADDLIWHPEWMGAILGLIAARPHVQVIGLNDKHTDLRHYAPHYMATADFCRDVLGGHLVPPVYQSWWFDREVCELAQDMGVYIPGWHAVAEHTHPDWGTALMDDTYSQAAPLHDSDRAIYLRRQRAGFPPPKGKES